MDINELIRDARDAEGDRLWSALRTQNPKALENAMYNRNLSEEMAAFIARSRNTPQEVLGLLASDIRFKKSYKLMRTLMQNPKLPQKVANSLLKFIKLFDLADLSRNTYIPTVTRQRIEVMLTDRLKAMPSGIKIALSRRANNNIVLQIMARSDKRVIGICLDSPRLVEQDLFKALNSHGTRPAVIRAIAEHPKWSLRYMLRYAMVRNQHTPLEHVERFLETLKSSDLKDLYKDAAVPSSTKPFIHMELMSREQGTEHPPDVTYELDQKDGQLLTDEEVSALIDMDNCMGGFNESCEKDEDVDRNSE